MEQVDGEAVADEAQEPAKAKPHGKPPPCGVVVGVVRRNWRSYCGALQPSNRFATIPCAYDRAYVVWPFFFRFPAFVHVYADICILKR